MLFGINSLPFNEREMNMNVPFEKFLLTARLTVTNLRVKVNEKMLTGIAARDPASTLPTIAQILEVIAVMLYLILCI